MSNNFTTRTASLRATTASVRKLDTKEVSINGENIDSKYASLNASNTFQSNNIFNGSISVFNTADFATTIRKGGTSENNEILNRAENDVRYAQLEAENTFTANNTFKQEVQLENGATANNNINLRSGDLLIHENGNLTFFDDGVVTTGEDITKSNISYQKVQAPQVDANTVLVSDGGYIAFQDGIDGTVVERSGASGYRYLQQVPTVLENGVCYDIGTISDNTDLSNITFTSEHLIQTCEIWFKTSATPSTTHQWPNGTHWIDSATGVAPTLLASKNYRIVFRREPNKIIASIAYVY